MTQIDTDEHKKLDTVNDIRCTDEKIDTQIDTKI